MEARRRHPLLRRHQERLLVRRGSGAFDPTRAGEFALHPQARRTALLQVAFHRRAVRRLFRGRAVAGNGPPCQRHGGAACGRSRTSKKVRLAWEPQANEVFAIMPRSRCGRSARPGARFYDWPRRTASPTTSRRTKGSAGSSPASPRLRRGRSVRRIDCLTWGRSLVEQSACVPPSKIHGVVCLVVQSAIRR